MVDHRSTSLPRCGPTDYPVTEPCYINFYFYWLLYESFYIIILYIKKRIQKPKLKKSDPLLKTITLTWNNIFHIRLYAICSAEIRNILILVSMILIWVIKCHHFNMEQLIPYSLICDLFIKNLETYWYWYLWYWYKLLNAITSTWNNSFHIRLYVNWSVEI